MSTLGKNLAAIRDASGLTQAQFAEKMQISQQRVSEWETDKVIPSLYAIMKIIKVLNTSFEELTEDIDLNK